MCDLSVIKRNFLKTQKNRVYPVLLAFLEYFSMDELKIPLQTRLKSNMATVNEGDSDFFVRNSPIPMKMQKWISRTIVLWNKMLDIA